MEKFTKGKSISVQGQSLQIPLAQAFRTEVCLRSGVVTVGAKTLTPGRGEQQNAALRGLRQKGTDGQRLPPRRLGLLRIGVLNGVLISSTVGLAHTGEPQQESFYSRLH